MYGRIRGRDPSLHSKRQTCCPERSKESHVAKGRCEPRFLASVEAAPEPLTGYVKTRPSSSGVARAAKALRNCDRRQASSSSGERVGSPTGWGMRPEARMRFAPAFCAIDVMAVSSTAGSPARSISLASVAPQRVPVPQVLVTMAAWTPSAMSCLAMALPMADAFVTLVPVPTVT